MAYTMQLTLCFLALTMWGCKAGEAGVAGVASPDRDVARPEPMPRCYGTWFSWGSWSRCSVTCGNGYQTRRRRCDSRGRCLLPERGIPERDGDINPGPAGIPFPIGCYGSSIDRRQCAMPACRCPSVNGAWSAWGCWSECKKGLRQRHRVCNRPIPQGWGSYCKGSTTQVEKCCAAGQDIVFAIDGSGSIRTANFNLMVSEVNSLIQSFDLDAGSGPADKVRVGIEVFNHRQILKKHLNNFVIPTTPYSYPGGGTNIGGAISYAQTQMFNLGRAQNPDTLVIITDGYSSNAQVAAAAAKNAGIKIIAVGVGNNVNINLLTNIVSNSSTDIYHTNNFCQIGDYLRKRFDCETGDLIQPAIPRRCVLFTGLAAKGVETDFGSS